jgi:hypothetical protein
MACVSMGDEKLALQNDVQVASWMLRMSNIVNYYEKATAAMKRTKLQ